MGKQQIIFSSMMMYTLFFYALAALDVYLLLPHSYHPWWLAAVLTPNIKIIILGQLSVLMVQSQMTEMDQTKFFGGSSATFIIALVVYHLCLSF